MLKYGLWATRLDWRSYSQWWIEILRNIDQNGIAELAVDRGLIKKVRILQLNLARTKSLQLYEEYINKTYQLETLTNEDDWKDPQWIEWEKPKGKVLDAYNTVLKANHIG